MHHFEDQDMHVQAATQVSLHARCLSKLPVQQHQLSEANNMHGCFIASVSDLLMQVIRCAAVTGADQRPAARQFLYLP
jgi:acyl-coenzyme A thioesterase PaaI-like protein